jgi:phosphoribosyl 1,2-cyclic phosphodiesterase
MRAWTLGSGSSGNALVVECDGERLLVDCGFGPRALATRLKAVGIAPESITALLVTHEHVDHAQGAERAQKKWRWPVFASAGTLDALRDVEPRWRRPVSPRAATIHEGFSIESVAVPHDAAAPLAFVLTATRSGARIAVAHDLGAVPAPLLERFAHCDLLCLEANHDPVMLRDGPYPAALKARIRGGKGHLSNDEGAGLAASLVHPGLKSVVLLHLSAVNNTPEVAERSVSATLRRAGYRGPVRAAPRREPTEVAWSNGPNGARRPIASGRSQLDLGL